MLKTRHDETPVHSDHYRNEYPNFNFNEPFTDQTTNTIYTPHIVENHAITSKTYQNITPKTPPLIETFDHFPFFRKPIKQFFQPPKMKLTYYQI